MNQPLNKILFFPITKMILGMSICFSLLVGIQNLVTKPIFRKIITSAGFVARILSPCFEGAVIQQP
jgi:hypothetical protein